MKILHTADVHLSENNIERLEALKRIVEAAESSEADALVIAGDLFDTASDVESLREKVRPLFSDNSFETLAIPGNHDHRAYRREDYLGEDFTLLKNSPIEKVEIGGANIVGVPYTGKDFSDLIQPVQEAREDGMENYLVFHGTLLGSSGGFGEEERYLPVKPEQIAETGFDYVLAGHIHSQASMVEAGGTKFLYPGSPASVTETETGRRKAWMIENEAKTVSLDNFHYQKQQIRLLPGRKPGLNAEDDPQASLIVELDGFTEDPEQAREYYREKAEGLELEGFKVRIDGLRSTGEIREDKTFQQFREGLEERNVENPELAEEIFLEAYSSYERNEA